MKSNRLEFFKNLSLYLLSLSIYLFQIYIVYTIESTSSTYLVHFKFIYFLFYLLSLVSNIQTALTNPGFISHDNNTQFINYYKHTRKTAVNRALMFNKNIPKHLLNPPFEEEEFSDCDNDDREFQTNDKVQEILQTFKREMLFDISECKKCHIAKLPSTHHCSLCHL